MHEPLCESKSDYWILSQLAERLGFKEDFTEGNVLTTARFVAVKIGFPTGTAIFRNRFFSISLVARSFMDG